jgi:Cellulase (glycosyl hydrolase family 5)
VYYISVSLSIAVKSLKRLLHFNAIFLEKAIKPNPPFSSIFKFEALLRVRSQTKKPKAFMKKFLIYIAVLLFLSPQILCAGSDPLSVSSGVLTKDGKPYRTIGINYYDAFTRYLENGDTSYLAGFQKLENAGIPFIRFNVLPNDSNRAYYMNNPTVLYTALDKFVADAQTYNIGLIPDVYWNWWTIPDIKGEPYDAWGNSSSQTRIFGASFAQALSTRYASNPTIWVWEMSNEYNLQVDNPLFTDWFSPVGNPSGDQNVATPNSPDNNFTSAQMLSAYNGFISAIHAGSSSVLVESGYGTPSYDAWHLAQNGSNTQDTQAEFLSIVASQYQVGDLVSMHIYPPSPVATSNVNQYSDQTATFSQILATVNSECVTLNKPFYLGEFGLLSSGADSEFLGEIDSVLGLFTTGTNSSGLASPWIFDLYWGGEGNDPDEYIISDARLAMISAVNTLMPYTYATWETQSVTYTTPQDFGFGAGQNFNYQYAVTGTVLFGPALFGDPDPGVTKLGYARAFNSVAGENGSYAATVPVEAAFGASGSYFYNWGTSGTINFNNATWGDPISGTVKGGYVMPYTKCVTDGQSFTFNVPTDVAYGANGHYLFKQAMVGTIAFNTATFGNPSSGGANCGYFRPSHISPSAPLANAGFETPAEASGGYQYGPSGGTWTFTGNSGIQNNGSAWNAPTAPQGVQTAFLQAKNDGTTNGSISQVVNFKTAGQYTILFNTALRPGSNVSGITLVVLVDGTVVGGGYQPGNTTSFAPITTSQFSVTAGNHTVQFQVLGTPVDSTIFVDNVQLLN